MNPIRTLALTALVAVPFVSQAADLGAATGYNAFVFGNFTPTQGVDAWGKIAVGGDIKPSAQQYNPSHLNGFAINTHGSGGAAYALVVNGKTTLESSSVNGSMFSNGDFVYTQPTVHGNIAGNGSVLIKNPGSVDGSIKYGTSFAVDYGYSGAYDYFGMGHTITQGTTASPFAFAANELDLKTKSTSWGGLAATGTTFLNPSNNLLLTGSVAGLNVFSVTAAQLAASNDFQVNVSGANATVLINVFGASVTMPQHAYSLSGVDQTHVLYNFVDATSLNTNSIGLYGSLLAPKADVVGQYGQLNGTLVAKSFTSGMELHDYAFTGNLPAVQAVPEPSTWAALGLGAVALLRRRRK